MGRDNYLWYEDDKLQEPVTELFDAIKWETPNAWLMGDSDGEENDVWLPKSQCQVKKLSNGFEATVPYWLAKKKGMV